MRYQILFYSLAFLLMACASLEKESKKYDTSHLNSACVIPDVNLITMETDTVLEHQTVITRDRRIFEIAPTEKMVVPANSKIIPGTGKYLLPGFADMHVHISSEADLLKFLKYGITTVRHMSDVHWWAKAMGFPDVLSLREKQRRQKIIGPDIYTCSYTLDGDPLVSPMNKKITDPRTAERKVRQVQQKGYDYIKIYYNLSLEAFNAIITAAKKYKIPVIGHVPFQVGIDRVLNSSVLSIEHLTGYINNNKASFIIPEDKISAFAQQTKLSSKYNCPTLVICGNLPAPGKPEQLKNHPEYCDLPWYQRWLWKKSLSYVYDISYQDKEHYARHMTEISQKMLLALYQADCPLLIGTDTNFIGVFPGYATLREMEIFSATGISNLDILRAATVTPAKALSKEREIGTIAAGKKAILVLLDANPLTDIKNIYRMTGVVIRG